MKIRFKDFFNVPNSLSMLRIVLIPIFVVTFLKGQNYYVYAGAALAFSALSDLFDGFFARRLGQITELGKWLDPIADKLTLGAVVACMWLKLHNEFRMLTPVFAVFILKELAMAIGGIFVVRGLHTMVPSQIWGKIGTASFYVCMLCIVLMSVFGVGGVYRRPLIIVLTVLPAIIMIWAFIRYCIFGVQILRRKRSASAQAEDAGREAADGTA